MKLFTVLACALSLTFLPAVAEAVALKDHKLIGLNGKSLAPSLTDGKVALVVNVASRCGYTRQYEGLQKLYESYKDRGFVILGAPCNQFGGQEPGSADEIAQFCKRNFGVTFPMLQKQDVNGKQRSALYTYLIKSSAGENRDIRWNFEKFLVGRNGKVLARFPSSTSPSDAALIKAIESAL